MKRSELLKAIEAVMVGVEKSGSSMLMDFITFDKEWIRSFKEAISVSYPLPTGLQTSVRAEELQKVISKMTDEEITLSITPENKFQASDSRTVLTLNPLQSEQYHQVVARSASLITDDLQWFYLPKNFMKGLELSTFSAGREKAASSYIGVHCEGSEMISTDNHRISHFILSDPVPDTFTIPPESADGFLKLNIGFTTISLALAWLHFGNESGAVFSTHLIPSIFPTQKVMNLFNIAKFNPEERGLAFPEGLDKSLERAEVMADVAEDDVSKKISQVLLYYKGGNLIIEAKRDLGGIQESIPWKDNHMPEGMYIKISPEYLKRILSISNNFQISPTKKFITFYSESYKHLMAVKIE